MVPINKLISHKFASFGDLKNVLEGLKCGKRVKELVSIKYRGGSIGVGGQLSTLRQILLSDVYAEA